MDLNHQHAVPLQPPPMAGGHRRVQSSGNRGEEGRSGRTYGYVRVSSLEQNDERQRIALRTVGVPEESVFADKQSGKDFDRPAYRRLLACLRPGDVLFIASIDRLGRNYEEIQVQWRRLTKELGVHVAVMDMPLLDTRLGRDLLGTFIADLVLQILSFVAQNEREAIRRRQAEGIAAAKARGVRFGRRERDLPEGFAAACEAWERGIITCSEAARRCALPRSTFRGRTMRVSASRAPDDHR